MTLLDFADSKSSSGSQPLPPTVPGQITFFTFLKFFQKNWDASEIIQNQISIESFQNLKNQFPGCPKLDF